MGKFLLIISLSLPSRHCPALCRFINAYIYRLSQVRVLVLVLSFMAMEAFDVGERELGFACTMLLCLIVGLQIIISYGHNQGFGSW